jgi:glycosyltransferase involved in cell wall biosynthesis
MKKNILFISGIDFKDKSIQVIRKTPEAYRDAGWEVDYIVARDDSPKENYYYEKEIDIEGINIKRIYWPISKHYNFPYILKMLLNKFYSTIVVFKLAAVAFKYIRKKEYQIIYGYEMHGVLAVNLIRFFNRFDSKVVSRFQGSFLYEMIKHKKYIKLAFNIDFILALLLPSELIVMTDDGTEGDKAIRFFKGIKFSEFLFLPNGVDYSPPIELESRKIIKQYQLNDKIVLIAISRLVEWKKVERVIEIFNQLKQSSQKNKYFLFILGEGEESEKLKKLVEVLDLSRDIEFLGGVKNDQVFHYLHLARFFVSMYAVSNVGNPLLESIVTNKFVITLNNGDTPKWIQHKKNGLIYDEDKLNFKSIAADIQYYAENEIEYRKICKEVSETAKSKLKTWEERFNIEISQVEKLISA